MMNPVLLIQLTENDKRIIFALCIVIILLFVVIGLLGSLVVRTMKWQGKKCDTLVSDVVTNKIVTTPHQLRRYANVKNSRCFLKQAWFPLILMIVAAIILVIHNAVINNWQYNPFNIEDGSVAKDEHLTFTQAFSNVILDQAEKNPKITAITAAMAQGTGLTEFSKKYRDRFFDVGIAEEHAVTFAGGQARGGMLPVVCIYSTFIQRAVDQMIHDISLQKSHAIFVLDRAGVVPNDGVTHQGLFDIALFRPVPGLEILSPVSAQDLKLCFEYAVEAKGPVVIRYPKANCPEERPEFSQKIKTGKGILIESEGKAVKNKYLVVTTGSMYQEVQNALNDEAAKKIKADIFIMRFIKPFNEECFISLATQYKGVLFVEDGVEAGGISEHLCGVLSKQKYLKTKILAFGDKYYAHGNRAQILEDAGLSPKQIALTLKGLTNA